MTATPRQRIVPCWLWALLVLTAGHPALAQSPDGARPASAATQATTAPTTKPATKPAATTGPATRPLATQPTTIAAPTDFKAFGAMVDTRISEVKADAAMDANARQAVLDLYGQAKAHIAAAQSYEARTKDLDAQAAAAPANAQALRAATTQPTSQPASAPAEASLVEMEAALRKLVEVDLADVKKKAEAADQSLKAITAAQAELPARIAKLREEVAALAKKTDDLRASTDAAALKQAQLAANFAKRHELEAQGKFLEKRLTTSAAIADLTRAQQAYFAREVARLEARIKARREQVAKRREEESRLQVAKARQEVADAADAHPLVRDVAEYNLYLTQLREGDDGLNARRKRIGDEKARIDARLARLQDAHSKAEKLISEVGQSDVIGLFLRTERAQLPDIREHRQRSQQRQERMVEVKLLLFRLEDKRNEIGDVNGRAEQLIASADPPIEPRYVEEVRTRLVKSLSTALQTLDALIRDQEEYFQELTDLELTENQLIQEAERFRSYIDKTVLWTRSAPRLGRGQDITDSWRALAWLTSADNWRKLGSALVSGTWRQPVSAGLAGLVIAALLLLRARLHRHVRRLGRQANKFGRGAMLRMLRALVMTLLSAAAWPGVVLLMGMVLGFGRQESPFADAVSQGLMTAAAGWLPLAVVIEICRKEGLGEKFFRWPTEALRRKLGSIRWLVAAALPLLLIAATLESQSEVAYRDSLGRIASISLLVILGAYVAWLFWPTGSLVAEGLGRRRTAWLYRFRMLWYPIAVIVPLWLAGAAVMGYYYTTLQLSGRLLVQLWVIITLVVLQATLRKWFTIGAARLARARLDEPPAESAGADGPVSSDSALPTVSEAAAQIRQFADYFVVILMLVSLWVVWADVLPALGVLRDVEMWTVGAGEAAVNVSLADLFLAILVLVLTVIASKNAPGILEVAVFRRLRIDAGVSYAINAMARYVIAVVGFVLTAQTIGIAWGHVQWLIAAVSVGLGFGLQEIFGNFISGLILLFERPIRVGDVVTVGDVSGSVTQIRIRATTILDWDRKELVVPNKEFITGRLVNWTLSDTILRVVIPVGVAYGSDTRLAHKLLLKVADENARVLKNPEPLAFFQSFGASSLDFDLRVYIGSISDLLATRHELHLAIDDAFRKAGVEIAFPQRDIHIRSIEASLPIENPGQGRIENAGPVSEQ